MPNNTVRDLCIHQTAASQIFSKSTAIKGIYVWGYEVAKTFVPLYVGKSRNIFERIIQHYCRFNGGEYCIPGFIYSVVPPSQKYSHNSTTMYIPTDLAKIFDLFNIPGFFLQNKNYIIDNFKFTYLEINEKTERKLAEKYLSDSIGKERLISSVPLLDGVPGPELKDSLDEIFGKYYSDNLENISLGPQ